MFVPRLLACGLIALSVVLILQQVVSRVPRPEKVSPDRLDSRQWLQTFGLLGLTILYAVLLPWLGFLLATPIYLLIAMLLSGAHRGISTGLTAVIVTGVIYVSFVYFFKVTLPSAPLP